MGYLLQNDSEKYFKHKSEYHLMCIQRFCQIGSGIFQNVKIFKENPYHLNMNSLKRNGKQLQNELPRTLNKQQNREFRTLFLHKHRMERLFLKTNFSLSHLFPSLFTFYIFLGALLIFFGSISSMMKGDFLYIKLM